MFKRQFTLVGRDDQPCWLVGMISHFGFTFGRDDCPASKSLVGWMISHGKDCEGIHR